MRRKKPLIPQGVPDPAPESVKTKISENLKRLRKIARVSQQDLADRAALDIHTIQNIEYKRYHARLSTLARLRKALKISWTEFLDGI